MKKYTFILAAATMVFGLTMTSCTKDTEEAGSASAGLANNNYDLYNRLGGESMVLDPNNTGSMIEQGRLTLRSVVDSTIFVIAGDSAFLNKFFPVLVDELGNSDFSGLQALSASLTDFFCLATGSQNTTYTGLDMEKAHNPATNPRMGALSDDADYDKFIGFVVEGAKQNGVPSTDPRVADLGKLLETLRTTIVQK